MRSMGVASKFNASMNLLDHLRQVGHHDPDKWLTANWSSMNRTSSFDFKHFFG